MLTKDTLLTAVLAASGGKQVIKYDDKGKPSVMVRIPKFNLEDISTALGSGPHPAFIVNGQEKNEIYIGAYQAVVDENRACSLPGVNPTASINFNNAKAACVNKGPGWHLMTNWEWAAVALWCLKNEFQPRGNTQWGRAHGATWETGVRQDGGNPGADAGDGRTLAGSGPASWRHDNTLAGIADMVGNIREWQDGFKIVNGKVYMPADNDFNLAEANWPNLTGDQVIFPESALFESGWRTMTTTFGSLSDAVKQQLAQAMIVPNIVSGNTPLTIFSQTKGRFLIDKTGERLPIRGGLWTDGASAGLAYLSLDNSRSYAASNFGFRPAFIL